MENYAEKFRNIGEPFAAGFFEFPEEKVVLTYCRAYRRAYENMPMCYLEGAPLFPSGKTSLGDVAVKMQYFKQYEVNWSKLEQKDADCVAIFRDFSEKYNVSSGWVHCALNYKRILAEGVDRYEERVHAMKNDELRKGLLDVLVGIRDYHSRALQYLSSISAPEALVTAMKQVPFGPARNAYEALVSMNFCLSLDGWDNVGRLDSVIEPYFGGEDLTDVLRCLFKNIETNGMWSITLGPDYSEVTRQALNASRGLSRPLVELRTSKNMPDDIWELALDCALSGGGQPSFYNEEAIQSRLSRRFPTMPKEDVFQFMGGGCTETSFTGMTYSGAVDSNFGMLALFDRYMRENLETATDFDTFYEGFCKTVAVEQDKLVAHDNRCYNERAKRSFAPIRTLFVDDCIDNEKGYYQGGARYTYAMPTDNGIPNTINSLLVIRSLVFERKLYTPSAFIEALDSDDAELHARIEACPCYGVGDLDADAIASDLTSRFYKGYLDAKLDIGLGFLPTSHQFRRHVAVGKNIGATPDGRAAGMPVADSIAAPNGCAVKGPTMMLLSASKYDQEHIYGIPVLNLSIARKYDPTVLRALIQGYFQLGGTQIQITAQDRETLLAAKADPQKHRDLIVRVGGYSDYFRNLTDELKDAVIARTIFE